MGNKYLVGFACALAFLLLCSISLNIYQYSVVSQSAEPEIFALEKKYIDAANTKRMKDMQLAHVMEKNAIISGYDEKISTLTKQLVIKEKEINRKNKEKIDAAKISDTALQYELAALIPADPSEIIPTLTMVTTTKRATFAWMDLTLQLKKEVDLCADGCTIRIAEREKEVVLPWVNRAQAAEEKNVDLFNKNQVSEALNEAYEKQAKKDKLEKIWIGIGVGVSVFAVTATGFLIADYRGIHIVK